MVVETRYAVGDGLLLGAADHWVLTTDPHDDDVVDELWAVISRARASDVSTTEQVLAIVEKAFGGDPPALAIVVSPYTCSARGAAQTRGGMGD